MKISGPQVLAFAVMFGYTVFGYRAISYLEFETKYCNGILFYTQANERGSFQRTLRVTNEDGELSEPKEIVFERRFCGVYTHGWYSCLSVFMLGYAIIIYRIFGGISTRLVKVIHWILHFAALAVLIFGCRFVKESQNILLDTEHSHIEIVKFAAYMYFLQIIVAFFMFYIKGNSELRIRFAPFHDLFGIWIFFILIGCCMSGRQLSYNEYSRNDFYEYNIYLYYSQFFLLAVLLNPFFEWELVGPM